MHRHLGLKVQSSRRLFIARLRQLTMITHERTPSTGITAWIQVQVSIKLVSKTEVIVNGNCLNDKCLVLLELVFQVLSESGGTLSHDMIAPVHMIY